LEIFSKNGNLAEIAKNFTPYLLTQQTVYSIIKNFTHSGNLAEMGKNFTPREVIEMIMSMALEKLQKLGEGDFMVLTDELNELAQSLANASMALQQLQQQDNAQQVQNILNPPQMLNPEGQDNYVNPGLSPSPRPGR
jgi:phage-related tail protein